MSFPDVLEAKYACRFRLITPTGCPVNDVLKRNIRKREFWRAKYETTEEAEVHPAWHLLQRVKGRERREAAQKSRLADSSATPHQRERIQQHAVPHEVQHRIDARGHPFADAT